MTSGDIERTSDFFFRLKTVKEVQIEQVHEFKFTFNQLWSFWPAQWNYALNGQRCWSQAGWFGFWK